MQARKLALVHRYAAARGLIRSLFKDGGLGILETPQHGFDGFDIRQAAKLQAKAKHIEESSERA